MQIGLYRDIDRKAWENFVLEEACNGTFMQTRRFLSYHPDGRFIDCSLMIRNSRGRLLACIPACRLQEDGKPVFFSHRGASYGGIVVAAGMYTAHDMQKIFQVLLEYLRSNGFSSAHIKLPSGLYSSVHHDLVEYMATLAGFSVYHELNTYIDISTRTGETISWLARGKRGHIRKCERLGMRFARIEDPKDIDVFHTILSRNLEKHSTRPVHSPDELKDFMQHRLLEDCRFFAVYLDGYMCAGGMVYIYPKASTVYTTYLAADSGVSKGLSPASYLYYRIICWARDAGFRHISFGISSEDQGRVLNYGLVKNKEAFGALHSLHVGLQIDL